MAIELGIFFLAKMTDDKASQVASALMCLVLAVLAVLMLHAEHLSSGSWDARTILSPWWYRYGWALLLCLPGIFWFWQLRHQAAKSGKN